MYLVEIITLSDSLLSIDCIDSQNLSIRFPEIEFFDNESQSIFVNYSEAICIDHEYFSFL